MIFIEHRKNTVADLAVVDRAHGVEIDLRSRPDGKIILAHDAFAPGEDFDSWLNAYSAEGREGLILLNTKEDGLEDILLKKLKSKTTENFLFLDTTLPSLAKNVKAGQGHRFMARLSMHEPLSAALTFAGSVNWLWVDCFGGEPLDSNIVAAAAEKFKLCLVSPELQGFDLVANLPKFLSQISKFSAICTKHPDVWKKALHS